MKKRNYPGSSLNRPRKKRRKFSFKILWMIPVVLLLGYLTLFLLVVPEREDVAFFADDGDRPLVIAHRGGAGMAPENTLVAFQKALTLGVDVIELDVHLSKDGHLVVIHDDTLDRTTDSEGRVSEWTAAQLQEVDAAYRFKDIRGHYIYRGQGITIPMLDEVFQEFPDARYSIEMKIPGEGEEQENQEAGEVSPEPDSQERDSQESDSQEQESPKDENIEQGSQIAERLWELIEKYDMHEQVLVSSFSEKVTDRFSELSQGEVALVASQEEAQRFVFYHKLFLDRLYRPKTDVLQLPPNRGIFNLKGQRLLDGAHRLNMQLHYWTVNEEQTMKELLELGVDGIITDRPDLLIRVLNEMEEFHAED